MVTLSIPNPNLIINNLIDLSNVFSLVPSQTDMYWYQTNMNAGERLYEVKKGLTIEECTAKAGVYISKNGVCLFLFDVKESKQSSNREGLQEQLFCLINELNIEFERYFPENNLATISRQEKGFYSLLGDGSWAGINNTEAIPRIANYIQKNYPNISFYYDVAVDGYDKATKLVK